MTDKNDQTRVLRDPPQLVMGHVIASPKTVGGLDVICSNSLPLVIKERLEQAERHGYTAQHDLEHDEGEIARGALAYLLCAVALQQEDPVLEEQAAAQWPWSREMFRPTDELSALVKCCAMLMAEIDRVIITQGRIDAVRDR